MKELPDFLTLEDILEIHSNQISLYGGSDGIRDEGLLQSALSMPMASFGGEYLHKSIHEMAAAYQDGVRLHLNRQPKSIKLENGAISGLEVAPTDGSGFTETLDAQWVVMAIGQSKLTSLVSLFKGVEMDDKGCVKVDEVTMQTSNPKVYAGGDCINGGKEVVNAAANGRDAAIDMLKHWL